MSEPIKITGHSDDAVRRLISWAQGKPNIEALLRNNSSARVDVLGEINDGDEFTVAVNGCRISYTATRYDTPATVAAALVELINLGAGSIEYDHFETYPLGNLKDVDGPLGTWSYFEYFGPPEPGQPPAKPLSVNNEISRSGKQSVRTTFDQGVYITGSPSFQNNAIISGYSGVSDDVQAFEWYFRFADGFPGVSNALLIVNGFIWYGLGPIVLGWLSINCATGEYMMTVFVPGGPAPTTFGPFSLADLLDGKFHKYSGTINQSTGDWTLYIDDFIGGSGSLSAAVPGNSFGLLFGNEGGIPGTIIRGVKNVYIDDFKIGSALPCGEYAGAVIPNPDESVELFTPGNAFNGTGEWANWTETPPGSPPGPPWDPPYLGGFIIDDSDARSGVNSFRTNLGGGVGPSIPGEMLNLLNIAMATSYPGNDLDYQEASVWVKFPSVATFPGDDFAAELNATLSVTLIFIDFSSGGLLWASITFAPSLGSDCTIGATIPGSGAGPTTTVPRSYIQDGEWHKLTCRFYRSGAGPVLVDLDNETYSAPPLSFPSGFTLGPSAFACLVNFNEIAGTVYTIPDVHFDDVVVGGEQLRTVPYKSEQLNADDPHFYVLPKLSPGLLLEVVPQDVNLKVNRLGVVDQLQELENALFDILNNRALDNSVGVQLDGIGEILGESRSGGMSDDDYRQLLSIRIVRNISSGEPERLIQVAAALTGSSTVQLQEIFPGLVNITLSGDPGNISLLYSLLDGIAAGGVRFILTQEPDYPFVFGGDPAGGGFDDGEFSRVIGGTVGSFPGGEQIEELISFPLDTRVQSNGVLGVYHPIVDPVALDSFPLWVRYGSPSYNNGLADDMLNKSVSAGEQYSAGFAIKSISNPAFSLAASKSFTLSGAFGLFPSTPPSAGTVVEYLLGYAREYNWETGVATWTRGVRITVNPTGNALVELLQGDGTPNGWTVLKSATAPVTMLILRTITLTSQRGIGASPYLSIAIAGTSFILTALTSDGLVADTDYIDAVVYMVTYKGVSGGPTALTSTPIARRFAIKQTL
jgi:hypothetical protein